MAPRYSNHWISGPGLVAGAGVILPADALAGPCHGSRP